MIQWQYFPKNMEPPDILKQVIEVFNSISLTVDSSKYGYPSDKVLDFVRPSLQELGFQVETGKKASQKIKVPVLFGLNGTLDKWFEADAYHKTERAVVEIEAGRGVANYNFLKDLFQACMMYDVEYLALAIRNIYKNRKDFDTVLTFMDTLYISDRLKLPLRGVLVIGY